MRAVILLLLAGCHMSGKQRAPIGAPCVEDSTCGTGRFLCATDHTGGYCFAECRDDGDCPSGSVCVGADAISTGACHVVCEPSRASCRAGYSCESAEASHSYCDMPGPRQMLRRVRQRAWR